MIISSHKLEMSASPMVDKTSYENTNYYQCNGKVMDIIKISLDVMEDFSFFFFFNKKE